MLIADTEDHSINHVSFCLGKTASQNLQKQLEPGFVDFFLHVVLNRQGDDPLAALFVCRVLPLWSNALFENEIVRVSEHF